MKKNQLIQDITSGDLLSAYVVASFDEGLKLLQKNNYSLIYLKENAQLRIEQGAEAYVSQYGNWVSEEVSYIPYKGIYLSKAGILNRNVKKATQSHRDGTDFYLTDDQVEEYRSDCVLLSDLSWDFSIPTNRFNEYEITNYAFGEQAEAYGNFLKENGIKEMPIWLTNMQDKPFAKKLRFSSLGFRSGLNGGSGDLCIYLNRARGVRKNIQESK